MPSKKKTAPVEEHLTEPAADSTIAEDVAIPEPATPDWKWPEATETRPLLVAWDDHDRSEAAVKFAELQRQKNTAEDRKKAAASQAKAIIDGLEEELNALMTRIEENGENRRVECRWSFETAGKDDTGALITHPDMKTLLREDTGEVVTICKITPDDRQLVMSLPSEMTDEEAESFLTENGYAVRMEEDRDPPFYVACPDTDNHDLAADNMRDALMEAVKYVRSLTPENSADSTTSQDSDPAPGGDSGEPSNEVMEAIREDGATTRRTRGKNSRASCPYEPGTKERGFWKAGFDAEDDRMEREMAAAEPVKAPAA